MHRLLPSRRGVRALIISSLRPHPLRLNLRREMPLSGASLGW